MNYVIAASAEKQINTMKKKKFSSTDAFIALIILGPMILWWVVVCGFPFLFNVVLTFLNWANLGQVPKFAGLDNLITFFTNKYYLVPWFNSIWIGGLGMLVSIIIAFGIALLMNLPLRFNGIYRAMWYIPAVTSVCATTQIIMIFIGSSPGILNSVIKKINPDFLSIPWGLVTFWGVFFIVLYTVWKNIGLYALLWLAGLKSIDPVLYEAACIDGANAGQRFIHIVLPGLKPISTYIILTGAISAMQIYEQVTFITDGGPYGTTEVLVTRILKNAFIDHNLGMAGTSATVLTLTVMVFAIAYFRYITKSNRSEKRQSGVGE